MSALQRIGVAGMYTYPHVVTFDETDLSGAVFHAHYLLWMNRARADLLGRQIMAKMWQSDGIGFAVARCDIRYRAPGRFGDTLVVGTTARVESDWRVLFTHRVVRQGQSAALADAEVELVCVGRDLQLVPLPPSLVALVNDKGAGVPHDTAFPNKATA